MSLMITKLTTIRIPR